MPGAPDQGHGGGCAVGSRQDPAPPPAPRRASPAWASFEMGPVELCRGVSDFDLEGRIWGFQGPFFEGLIGAREPVWQLQLGVLVALDGVVSVPQGKSCRGRTILSCHKELDLR
jgi:hypothetical protein